MVAMPLLPFTAPVSNVVDFASYRAARAANPSTIGDPVAGSYRPCAAALTPRAVAHRERMLQHLRGQTAAAE